MVQWKLEAFEDILPKIEVIYYSANGLCQLTNYHSNIKGKPGKVK